MINGKISTFARDDVRASAPGHGPVLQSGKLPAADGVYPVGLLLTFALAGLFKPLQAILAEVLATGDGVTKAYSVTLAAALPLEPGTLVVTDGVETFTDDGLGRLTGDAGGTGTVVYRSGEVTLSFNANVVNLTNVTADYTTSADGVLDELVDTAASASGQYIAHGTCRRDALKVGAVAQAAPTAAVLLALKAKGIFPVG